MRGIRFDRLLAGTALVLVLGVSGLPAVAAPDDAAIEALVPIPEPANVPPPTAADIGLPTPADATVPAAAASTPTEPPAIAVTTAPAAPAAVTTEIAPAAQAAPATQMASPPQPATPTETQANVAPATPTAAAQASPAEPAPPTTAAVPPAVAPVEPAAPTIAAPAAREPEKTITVTAPPAPTLDQQVAEKLHATLAKSGKRDKGLEAFYAARDFAPVWIIDGAAGPHAQAAAAYLAKVDADGLDPADYVLPQVKAGSDAATLAETELKFSSILLTYARHASNGRVHWSRVSADVYYAPTPFEPAEVLAKIVDAKDTAAALDSFNPQQPGYKALKAKYAEARGKSDEPAPARINAGPVLKLVTKKGKTILMDDARVPQLRARLGLEAVPHDDFYDKPLSDAVKKFQSQHGLPANGQLTNATVDVLNGRKRDRDADIILANMERWRWLPQDLGKAYVMLNIPDYTLKVVNNGATVWSTRVVVGQPGKPTPILTETMKYITVNPTWNVPPSIIYNEYLPALQQDPTVLDRMGLKLEQNRDGSVHISQPPGERNALGRIRFNFPNKFLVYQHDTPDKQLFAHDKRAYSHGCMRVQDPAKYAEVLLGIALPNEGYTADRIKKMFGTTEHDIKFPTPIPVHITYQTAFVDDAGKLQIRNDVYGRDSRVLAALKGDDRRMADVPMERAQPNYSRPPVRLPERYAGTSDNSGGFSFFGRLFGGPPEPPAPVHNNARRTYQR